MSTLKPSKSIYFDYDNPMRIVKTIFLCWGFITVINGPLLQQLGAGMKLTSDEIDSFAFIFFGAYFVFGIPASLLIKKFGFKRTLVIGLLVSAASVVPIVYGARAGSYQIIILALAIQGTGFAILQVTANPYVILMGNPKHGASRLSTAGAYNSFGTWLAPLLGSLIATSGIQKTFINDAEKLAYQTELVILPYVLIAVVFVGLSVLVHFSDMPTMDNTSQIDHNVDAENPTKRIGIHLFLSFLAIFFYVGAEVAIAGKLNIFIETHLATGDELQHSLKYIIPYYWGGAMVGRFVGASALKNTPPHRALGFCSLIAIVLIIASVVTPSREAMFPILAIGLFNGIMWPVIFELGIRGMGRFTPLASAILIMGILGGAVIPSVVNHIAVNTSFGLNGALTSIIICYAFLVYYAFSGHKYKEKDSLAN